MPKKPDAAAPVYSTAQDFLKLKGRRRLDDCEAVERWGLKAQKRSLSAREKNEYESATWNKSRTGIEQDELKLQKVRLISLCLVDGEGNRIFDDEHLPELLELDAGLVDPVFVEVSRFVGFADGDVEDLVKNSGTIAAAVSPAD